MTDKTPYTIHDLDLIGRRTMRDKSKPQRPYFLTPGESVVYYDLRSNQFISLGHSIRVFLEFVDVWKSDDRWFPSFSFHHKEAEFRARFGVPIPARAGSSSQSQPTMI